MFSNGDTVRINNLRSIFFNAEGIVTEVFGNGMFVSIGGVSHFNRLDEVTLIEKEKPALTPTVADISANHTLISLKRVELETETIGNVIINLANRGEMTPDAQEYLTELWESLTGKVTETLGTITHPQID